MKTTNTIAEAVTRKVRKNGSRGTSFDTLLATARSIRPTAKKSDVRNVLNKIDADEVRDGFHTLAGSNY